MMHQTFKSKFLRSFFSSLCADVQDSNDMPLIVFSGGEVGFYCTARSQDPCAVNNFCSLTILEYWNTVFFYPFSSNSRSKRVKLKRAEEFTSTQTVLATI